MSRIIDAKAIIREMANALHGTEQGAACELALKLFTERDEMLTGRLVRAGELTVNEETVCGLLIQCDPDKLAAVKTLPMYETVTLVS